MSFLRDRTVQLIYNDAANLNAVEAITAQFRVSVFEKSVRSRGAKLKIKLGPTAGQMYQLNGRLGNHPIIDGTEWEEGVIIASLIWDVNLFPLGYVGDAQWSLVDQNADQEFLLNTTRIEIYIIPYDLPRYLTADESTSRATPEKNWSERCCSSLSSSERIPRPLDEWNHSPE